MKSHYLIPRRSLELSLVRERGGKMADNWANFPNVGDGGGEQGQQAQVKFSRNFSPVSLLGRLGILPKVILLVCMVSHLFKTML